MADSGRPRRLTFRPAGPWIAAIAGILVIAATWLFVNYGPAAGKPADFGPSQRDRRIAALRTYAARSDLGSLLPQTDAVLAIREQFLRSVVTLSLPFRQYFDQDRYVARLDSADVRLESGLARVTMSGRGMLAGQEDSPFYADLELSGLLNVTGVDPDSGTLQASVVITDVHSRRSRVAGREGWLNPVAHFFGRLKAQDWNRNRQAIVLPLRVDQQIVLPEIEGDVSVPESRVPISVRVSSVTTLAGRMAISLALLPDSTDGERVRAPERLWNQAPRVARAPERWLRALRPSGRPAAEEESLRVRVGRLAGRDPLWGAVVASDHDVVAVVPASMLTTVVARATRRYLRGVEVDIRPKAVIPVDAALRVKLLDRRMSVGRLRGDIRIAHLAGRLAVTDRPRLRLEPPNELTVISPVRLLAGHGLIDMDMEWAPGFLVGMVCRGFHFHESLAGELVPVRDTLQTRIHCAVRDSVILLQPRLERDSVRMSAELTPESWRKVRDVLVSQDRIGRCGLVMHADSALVKLQHLAGTGMTLHLPEKNLTAFRAPVVLENHYRSGVYRIEAMAFDPAISVATEYLRLAFRVNLQIRSSAASAAKSPAGSPAPAAAPAPRP